MLFDWDDWVQARVQFLADWAYTLDDRISPWLVGAHCLQAGGYLYVLVMLLGVYPVFNKLGVIMCVILFFTASLFWFTMMDAAHKIYARHLKWLNGESVLAPLSSLYLKRYYAILTIAFLLHFLFEERGEPTEVISGVIFQVAVTAVCLGYYLDCCSQPSGKSFNREVLAGA